jgi:four helix bundle protein
MSRDHRKLKAFQLADALVVPVYRATARFPEEERFGLRSQIRRAVLSAPTNIVEGCARRSLPEYVNFLNVSNGSAAELRYLLDVALRLEFLTKAVEAQLGQECEQLLCCLRGLIRSLDRLARRLISDRATSRRLWRSLASDCPSPSEVRFADTSTAP